MGNKKQFLNVLFLVSSFLFCSSFIQVENSKTLAASIASGDAGKMARHFDKNVDINMNNNLNTYSKAQAEMVIQNFFKTNKISKYKVLYTGSANSNTYIIAKVSSNRKEYNMFFMLYEKSKDNFIIQSIKID